MSNFSITLKHSAFIMIYLNGQYLSEHDAKIATNDRGFLLSDGIFETMRAYNGKVACLFDHYQRLKEAASFLNIPFALTLKEFASIANHLIEQNELTLKDASLRITLTRGTGPRGLLPPQDPHPTLLFTIFPFPSTVKKPLSVVVSDIRRNEFSPLSNIKSLSYLDNIIARERAAKKGADECIMLNTSGNIACASVANIFLVTSKGLITPQIEDGVLPGITRKIVLALCRENNIPVYEEKIPVLCLTTAHEVFLTNTLIEIQPVVQINGTLLNNGEAGRFTLRLQELYISYIKNDLDRPVT